MLGFAPLSTLPLGALPETSTTAVAASGTVTLEWRGAVQASQAVPYEVQGPIAVTSSSTMALEWRAPLAQTSLGGLEWRAPVAQSGVALVAWQQGVRASAVVPREARGRVVQLGALVLAWEGRPVAGGDIYGRYRSGPAYRGEVASGSLLSGRSLSRAAVTGIWMSGY